MHFAKQFRDTRSYYFSCRAGSVDGVAFRSHARSVREGLTNHSPLPLSSSSSAPTGSFSRGGDVDINVFDINRPSLPAPLCSVLVSISVFIALSHSVLPILFLL